MEQVYKVVQVTGGKRHSVAFLPHIEASVNDYMLEYRPNKWVTPLVGKIFCFSSLEAAENFTTSVSPFKGHFEVWEAKAKRVSQIKTALDTGEMLFNPILIELFWESNRWKRKRNLYSVIYQSVPKGTIVARAIKLVRRIK